MEKLNIIETCKVCGDLKKLSCDSLKKGKVPILVVGESPAADGWIKSGVPFYTTENKLQATGKVLQKLLSIINVSIDDIYFTECCKCVIEDRSKLQACAKNCKPFLMEQIEKSGCVIIIPMGKVATETLVGLNFDKMQDYVGVLYPVNFKSGVKFILPLYHPSPANPKGYTGNAEILQTMKEAINRLLEKFQMNGGKLTI